MPKEGEYLYPFCVETKAALILGGGGITGGMYELGALSAMDDFIVSGRKSGQFDLYVGISAGSILAAFLANGITVNEMCSAVLGEKDQGLLLRREDIYEYYHPETGENPPKAAPIFGWSSSIFIELAIQATQEIMK